MFVLVIILLLAGCGNKSLINNDLKKDTEQVLEALDLAYEEDRELNETEEELFQVFRDKYISGMFLYKDKAYEMNDLEKNLIREIVTLRLLAEQEAVLASEKSGYEEQREIVADRLNSKEIPEELKGKYPTYQIQNEPHPEFIKDTKWLIGQLDGLMSEGTVDDFDSKLLTDYLDKYGGEGFEVDGNHYLHSDESLEMYMVFWAIEYDLEQGALKGYTKDGFFNLKEELGMN